MQNASVSHRSSELLRGNSAPCNMIAKQAAELPEESKAGTVGWR
jgi:hypothetical protein